MMSFSLRDHRVLAGFGLGLVVLLSAESVATASTLTREQRQTAQEVYFSIREEAPSMDPNKQADAASAVWLGHIFEGLMTYDLQNKVVPGTAESYTVSADKKTYTFKIRKEAKWHDGKPVRAQDFVYTFRRIVDPTYASEYAFIADVAGILNAADITAKKMPVDKLGVRAVDDQTLELKLSRPVTFLPSMMAFQIFYPVREDIVKKYGDRFATVTESIVGNGPFRLVSWQKEQSMRLEKSPQFWNAKAIQITAISSPSMVKDGQANFNNFSTGGIDIVLATQPELLKQAQDLKMRVQSYSTGCTSYNELNIRKGAAFESKDLRLALRDGMNRREFVNKVIGLPGTKVSFGLVPDFLPGSQEGKSYRSEAPISSKDGDIAAAKQHIAAYTKATGKKVPSFTILSGDTSAAKKYAEYWQNALAKLLDTTVKIENVTFKTRLQRMRDGQFDMVLAGWCPDYRDPMTFMDLFTSKNENNHTGWGNVQFDALIEKANLEADAVKRVALMHEAEKLLLDDSPTIVTDLRAEPYIVADGLVGVRRGAFGADMDFRFAKWTKTIAKK
jgi:oligopeptide transport system substrate-binding protein